VKTLLATAFAVALSLPLTASAEDFQTVDQVQRYANGYTVKGIPVGKSQADTANYTAADPEAAASCERDALLMMLHPGRFVLTVGFYCTLTTRTQ
jgi:hypothetical protein